MRQGTIHVVSDGSFFNNTKIGAVGWILESSDGEAQVTGAKGVTGPQAAQNSCRSELAGILCSLLT